MDREACFARGLGHPSCGDSREGFAIENILSLGIAVLSPLELISRIDEKRAL